MPRYSCWVFIMIMHDPLACVPIKILKTTRSLIICACPRRVTSQIRRHQPCSPSRPCLPSRSSQARRPPSTPPTPSLNSTSGEKTKHTNTRVFSRACEIFLRACACALFGPLWTAPDLCRRLCVLRRCARAGFYFSSFRAFLFLILCVLPFVLFFLFLVAGRPSRPSTEKRTPPKAKKTPVTATLWPSSKRWTRATRPRRAPRRTASPRYVFARARAGLKNNNKRARASLPPFENNPDWRNKTRRALVLIAWQVARVRVAFFFSHAATQISSQTFRRPSSSSGTSITCRA